MLKPTIFYKYDVLAEARGLRFLMDTGMKEQAGWSKPIGKLITAKLLASWQRRVIEASKQCGRNQLMQIVKPSPLGEFLSRSKAENCWQILLSPQGIPLIDYLQRAKDKPRVIILLIGPEGDFTEEELAAAKEAGFVTLQSLWGRPSCGWRPRLLPPPLRFVRCSKSLDFSLRECLYYKKLSGVAGPIYRKERDMAKYCYSCSMPLNMPGAKGPAEK